jgi:hypothetical protein
MFGYKTAKEKAVEWNVSDRMVQMWCKEKIIDGVTQFGNVWAIPEDAVKPTRTINQKPGRKPKATIKNLETTEAL